MKKYVLSGFCVFTLLFNTIEIHAQISLSSDYSQICTWNESTEEFEDCELNEEGSFFVINKAFTLITHTTESKKSIYYIKNAEVKKEDKLSIFEVVSDLGNKYSFFLYMKEGVLIAFPENSNRGVFFHLKAVFDDESSYTFDRSEPNEDRIQAWTGTGFAISNSGHIATNNHVVEGAFKIEVIGIRGNQQVRYKANVVATDPEHDLAIIRITDERFTGIGEVPYSISYNVDETGEEVFVLGYPDPGLLGQEIKLTNGIISSVSGYGGAKHLYQITAPVQGGNSGGPMFDKDGKVTGVVVAKVSEHENVAYAIKSSYLIDLFENTAYGAQVSSSNAMRGKSLKDQTKLASKFVYLIIVNFFEEGEEVAYQDNDGQTNEGETNRDEQEDYYNDEQEEIGESPNSFSLLESAKLHLKNGEIEEAIYLLDQAIEKDYENYEAFFYRGWIKAYYTYDYHGAIADYTQSLKSYSEVSFVFYERGRVYAALNKFIDAVKDFNTAIKLEPNNLDAYFNRALAKSALGDLDATVSDYREILKRYTSSSNSNILIGTVYNNIASSLIQMGELTDAERYLDRAMELEPNESYIWGTKGELLYQKGRYKECIETLNKAISLENSKLSKATNLDPGANYFYRGMAKIELGDSYEGCQDLKRAERFGFYSARYQIGQKCD